jgi:hypothetical protein
MTTIELRPPLPSNLSHDGVPFVLTGTRQLPAEVVAAVGAALHALLPTGDLTVLPTGQIQATPPASHAGGQSLWQQVARIESIERNRL